MVNLADPDCLKDFQSTAPMVTISYPHEGFSLHYRTSNNSPTSSKRSSLEPETSTAAEVEDIINHDAPKMGYPLIETCPMCERFRELMENPPLELPRWEYFKEELDHIMMEIEVYLQREFRRLKEFGVHFPRFAAVIPPFHLTPRASVALMQSDERIMREIGHEQLLIRYLGQKQRLSRLCGFIRDIQKASCSSVYQDLKRIIDSQFESLIRKIQLIHAILTESLLNNETLSDHESKRRKKAAEAEARRQKDVEEALIRRNLPTSACTVQAPPHIMFVPGFFNGDNRVFEARLFNQPIPHAPIDVNSWREEAARLKRRDKRQRKQQRKLEMEQRRIQTSTVNYADLFFPPEEYEKSQNSPDSGLPPSSPFARAIEHVIHYSVECPFVLEIGSEESCTESESVCSTSREPSPLTMEEELERRRKEQIESQSKQTLPLTAAWQRMAVEKRGAREEKETEIREKFRKKVEEAIGLEKIAERRAMKPAGTSAPDSPSSPSPPPPSSTSIPSSESSLLMDHPEEETNERRELRLSMEEKIVGEDQMKQLKMVSIWRAWTRGISIMRAERKAREDVKKEEAIQRRHDLIMEIVRQKEIEKEKMQLRALQDQQELEKMEWELLQQEQAQKAQQKAEKERQVQEREAEERARRAAKEEEKKRNKEVAQRRVVQKARLAEEKRRIEEEEKRLEEEERAIAEMEEEEKRREDERLESEREEAERQRQSTLDRETRKAEERRQKAEAAEKEKMDEEDKRLKAVERAKEEKRDAERRRQEREVQAAQRREEQQKVRKLALQRAKKEKIRQQLSLEEIVEREEEERRMKMEEMQAVVAAQLTPPISPSQSTASKSKKRKSAKKTSRQSTLTEETRDKESQPVEESEESDDTKENDETEEDEFQVAIPKNSRKKEIKFDSKIYKQARPELNEQDKKVMEIRKAFQEREAKEEKQRELLERTVQSTTYDSPKTQNIQKHPSKKKERDRLSREFIEEIMRKESVENVWNDIASIILNIIIFVGINAAGYALYRSLQPREPLDRSMRYYDRFDYVEPNDCALPPQPAHPFGQLEHKSVSATSMSNSLYTSTRPELDQHEELQCLFWVFKPGPSGACFCVKTPPHYHLSTYHDDAVISLADQESTDIREHTLTYGECEATTGTLVDVDLKTGEIVWWTNKKLNISKAAYSKEEAAIAHEMVTHPKMKMCFFKLCMSTSANRVRSAGEERRTILCYQLNRVIARLIRIAYKGWGEQKLTDSNKRINDSWFTLRYLYEVTGERSTYVVSWNKTFKDAHGSFDRELRSYSTVPLPLNPRRFSEQEKSKNVTIFFKGIAADKDSEIWSKWKRTEVATQRFDETRARKWKKARDKFDDKAKKLNAAASAAYQVNFDDSNIEYLMHDAMC